MRRDDVIKELKGDPTLSAIAGCIESADLWLPGTGKREAWQHPGGTETKNPLDEWKTKCPGVTSDGTKGPLRLPPRCFHRGFDATSGRPRRLQGGWLRRRAGTSSRPSARGSPCGCPLRCPGSAREAVRRRARPRRTAAPFVAPSPQGSRCGVGRGPGGRLPPSLPRLHKGVGAASGAAHPLTHTQPLTELATDIFGPKAKGPS